MKRLLVAISLLATVSLQAFPWPSWLFNSTPESAAVTLSPVDTFPTGASPSFVRSSHNSKFLAVTNTTDNTVSVYSVDRGNGELENIQTVPTVGTNPIALSYSPCDDFAVVANFGDIINLTGDSISVFKINTKTGKWKLIQTIDAVAHSEIASPGSISYSPDGKFVAVSNFSIGANPGTIAIYKVNEQTGRLTLVKNFTITDLGVYGRVQHIAYSPDGQFLAAAFLDSVPNNDGFVATFPVDQTTGKLEAAIDTATTKVSPFGVTFSHNGQLLTVCNAGTANSVSVFTIDQAGTLSEVASSPFGSGGSGVRFLAFSKNDHLAVVTNNNSNNLSIFCVDQTTGVFGAPTLVTAGGTQPRGIDIDHIGKFANVTLNTSNQLAVFEVNESSCP